MVTLNRAAALAMADGPAVGLALLATIDDDPKLAGYQPLHATRCELHAWAGDLVGAALAYRKAAALTDNPIERRALLSRATRYGVSITDE